MEPWRLLNITMRLKCLVFLLIANFIIHSARAQKPNEDSVALPVQNEFVKSNELFFDALIAKLHKDELKSKSLFEQFTALYPSQTIGYYELAKLYTSQNKTDLAATNMLKAYKLDTNNKWICEDYANLLARQSKFVEAATLIAKLAKEYPADEVYPIMASDFYEKAGDYKGAIKYVEKAIVLSGDDEDYILRKAQLYQQLKEIDKCVEIYRGLIKRDPKNGKYYKLLADVYEHNNQPQKAAEVLQQAQQAAPGEINIDLALANQALKKKDTLKFRIHLKSAILNGNADLDTRLDLFYGYIQNMTDSMLHAEALPVLHSLLNQYPNEAPLHATYAEFLQADDKNDQAIEEFKKSVALKPSNFIVWEKLLGSLTEKKNADTLIKYADKAIRLFPTQAMCFYFRGIGYYNKSNNPLAIKSLQKAIELQPEEQKQPLATMYIILGDVYHAEKMHKESDEAYDKAISIEPNDAILLNNYSYDLAIRSVQLDKALTMSAKSLTLRPNNATFMDTNAWIYFKKGDYKKAKEILEKAIQIASDKSDPDMHEHLGDVYFKLNDKVKALEQWNMAKQKGSDSELLIKKISEQKLYE